MLRPVFQDQLPDEDAYAAEFDRAEVTLGVLAQDAVNVRIAAASDGRGWGRSHWFGRSTWRAAKYQRTAVDELRHEFAIDGERWGRLRGQLFGGDADRAKAALEMYAETFAELARQRAF